MIANGPAAIDLWMCASSGDVVGVERLLEMGADPSEKNEHGETPFLAACIYGHMECARILMPVSDPDDLANGGLDGLMMAATFGHIHMLDELSVWCKRWREDENGWDASALAAAYDYPACALHLLFPPVGGFSEWQCKTAIEAAKRYANFETADAIGQALSIQLEKRALGAVAQSPEQVARNSKRM